jgi:phosphatidylinositol alpha 1,6-mannosyltransferase
LPVIAAEATGTTNLVRDGVTGILVDYSDVDGFADALATYAKDPELRRRHGGKGLEFAKTMDWDTINSAVLKVYERALAKRERFTRMARRSA